MPMAPETKKLSPDEFVAYLAGFLSGKSGIILDDATLAEMREVATELYFSGYDSGFNTVRSSVEEKRGPATTVPAEDPILCPCPECSEEEDFWDMLDDEEFWDEIDEHDFGTPVTIRIVRS